ncbi:siderophore-interacting protein [Rhodococcus erythropolis]|uniref:siderophore-interacting protein n=1 Tax=Rhodococcus erythropolis TaxID=1833 RepID=UPI00105C6D5F
MTTASRPEETETSASAKAPRGEDHDRGLNDVVAVVESVERPTESILRITVQLTSSADDPNWLRPNVAFRIQLGPQYGDVSRVYTVRTFDASSGSMTFDVVLHGHTSPMMRWADDRRVGDTFSLTGPRPHFLVPEITGRRVALFADDTAIPALYSILLQWPEGVTGVGWVATGDAEAFAELPVIPGLALHHVEDCLAEYAVELDNPGDYAVWGAGERDEMRSIRAHFRKTVGLAKDDVVVFGYWKRGVSTTEIDQNRLRNYTSILENGGTLADIDDLAIGI